MKSHVVIRASEVSKWPRLRGSREIRGVCERKHVDGSECASVYIYTSVCVCMCVLVCV